MMGIFPSLWGGLDRGGLLVKRQKPSLKSNDKEGFIRAFTDEWRDLQHDYHVVLEFVVEPAHRAGVLRLSLTALSAQNGHTGPAAAYYQCEYPTAALESFEACLFRCAVRLERVLRDRQQFPQGKA